ncbi:reverse transcriptase RNaseH [Colletotrichum musicola]|uniref:Reverse transcriptase RNaseH n=1 Tax=Colletotrichum musicola TaxID=2175873 RepID=A0A8H6MLJ6_9PEZI|nr:reverse transcriptase RNaseH [Colletotrichum musicola]
MVIYLDGSKALSGATGYGFIIYRGSRRVAQGCGWLGLVEVFNSEAKDPLESRGASACISFESLLNFICLNYGVELWSGRSQR